MDHSPFNRSGRTARTPPPTPASPVTAPTPRTPMQADRALEVKTTQEVQNWLLEIQECLNEVCSVAEVSKMNIEQKMKVSTLCRNVAHKVSSLAVQYQALKSNAIQAHSTIKSQQEKLDLSQRLQDLKQTIEVSSKSVTTTPSFAEMVKKSAQNFIQPVNLSTVAIYPSDKLKSSDETKTLVQKIICPEKMNLHVRGLRKIRNGGVIISTESRDDIEKVKQSLHDSNSGLTINEPHKRKPRVVIVGVPSTMKETEVLTCLYHQNLEQSFEDCDLENFLSEVKLSHKSGRRDAETCNYIIEVSAAIRKALIVKDRIFINWSSCPVKDYTLVTRCYKCQHYGHAAKSCRESQYTCGHCGNQGHTIKECTTKSEDPKCATCLHFKKPSNHITGSIECPAKAMAEKRYINSVDYGVA